MDEKKLSEIQQRVKNSKLRWSFIERMELVKKDVPDLLAEVRRLKKLLGENNG